VRKGLGEGEKVNLFAKLYLQYCHSNYADSCIVYMTCVFLCLPLVSNEINSAWSKGIFDYRRFSLSHAQIGLRHYTNVTRPNYLINSTPGDRQWDINE